MKIDEALNKFFNYHKELFVDVFRVSSFALTVALDSCQVFYKSIAGRITLRDAVRAKGLGLSGNGGEGAFLSGISSCVSTARSDLARTLLRTKSLSQTACCAARTSRSKVSYVNKEISLTRLHALSVVVPAKPTVLEKRV